MADSSKGNSVLVVGAGPTGLFTACDLLRRGISCRLVEKLPVASDKSRALVLHSRMLELFENMGIADRAIERGSKAFGMTLYSGAKRLAHMTFEELQSPYQYALMISQVETERLLAEFFTELGGKIERGVELIAFEQSRDKVTVTLKDSEGRQERADYEWLIGCDGAHSTVRHVLNLPFEGSQYEEPFVLADVIVEGNIAHDELSSFFHESGILAFFPMVGGRFRVMGDIGLAKIAGEAPTLAEMQEIVDTRSSIPLKLNDPHWLATFKLNRRSVADYQVGRAFLVGDSAHIHSPFGGQGMNTGMQDGFNLSWKLALVIQGKADASLLASYTSERHSIGQSLLKGTDLATKVATLRHPLAQQLRNSVMSFMSQQELVQERLGKVGSMHAVNYRHSPLVGQCCRRSDIRLLESAGDERPSLPSWIEFARGPLPGDRAPDATVTSPDGQTERFFQAWKGTAFNLILFDGKPSAEGYKNFEEIVRKIKHEYGNFINIHIVLAGAENPMPSGINARIWLDPELTVHHTYAADAECLYLVRPDGHIGFRSQPARIDDLSKHLSDTLKLHATVSMG